MKTPAWVNSAAFGQLVRLALEEDAVRNDVTSLAVVPGEAVAIGTVVAKQPGRIAGLPVLADSSPLMAAFPALKAGAFVEDGADVAAGATVASIRGSARDVLALERTLLNFLQRLSGIATATARYVAACAGTKARIMDTRKTVPGFRALDKYAVLMGGGFSQRMGLGDQILIKDNHLLFAGAARSPASIRDALAKARAAGGPAMLVEIEVETMDQLAAALAGGADIVLLDNMTAEQHAEAVKMRKAAKATALLEASGGITLENVAAIAKAGVDRISIGALTHSVKALDLAMDMVPGPSK